MSRPAIYRFPFSGLFSALAILLGAVSHSGAQSGESGRICEVKPAMRCLDKSKIEGDTLRVPIDAAAIQKDGFLICDSSFNYTTAPDIVLIMDNTGSMDSVQTLDGVARWCMNPALEKDVGCISGDPHNQRGPALQTFLDSAVVKGGKGMNVGVVTFSQGAEAKTDKLVPLNAVTKDSIKASIQMAERGETNYSAAFRAAMELLSSSRKPKSEQFIIFVSDGRPNFPQKPDGDPYYYKTFWDSLPTVHSIFLGDNKDNYKDMQDVSAKTGGFFYNTSDVGQLAKILTDDLAKKLFRRAVPTLTTVRNLSNNITFQIDASQHVPTADSGAYILMMPGPLELAKGINDFVFKTEYGYGGATQDVHFKIARTETGPYFTGLEQKCRALPKLLIYNAKGDAINLLGESFTIADSAVKYALTTSAALDSFDVVIKTSSTVTAQQDLETVPNSAANRKDSTWTGAEAFQHQTIQKTIGDNLVQAEHRETIIISYHNPFIREDSVTERVKVKYGPDFDKASYRDLNSDGRIETVTIRFLEPLANVPDKLKFSITDAGGAKAERTATGGEIVFAPDGTGGVDRNSLIVTLATPFPFGMTSVANPDSSGHTFRQINIPMADGAFRVDDSVPPVIVKADVTADKGDGHSIVKVTYSEPIKLAEPFLEPLVFKRDTVVFTSKDMPVKRIEKVSETVYTFHLQPGLVFKPVGGDSVSINNNGETRDGNGLTPKSLVYSPMGGPSPSQAISDFFVTFANGSKSDATGGPAAVDKVSFIAVDSKGAAVHCDGCSPMQNGVFTGSVITLVTKQPVDYDFTIYSNLGQLVSRGSGKVEAADLLLLDKKEDASHDPNQTLYFQRIVWTGRTESGMTAGTGAYVLKATFHYGKNFKTGARASTGTKITKFGFVRTCCDTWNKRWYD